MHTGLPCLGLQTSIWALLALGGIRAQRGIGTLSVRMVGCFGWGLLTSLALCPEKLRH